jgi:hypothetical protein
MKPLLITLVLFLSLHHLFSQENPNSNAIQTSMKVKALQEKKAEFHRRTNGECDGYRVKIHFSADRTKAKEVKARFISKYNDVPTYEDYQQPNFVINVGDFKTKLEAYELFKKIQVDFPYAFIVKSKVRPMKLN